MSSSSWGASRGDKLGQATVANLEDGLRAGLQDMDVGAMLKLREEQAGVTVRLRPS